MSHNLFGSCSYTWSASKRRDDVLLPLYDFDFDRTHNVILIGGYKFSKKWQVGLKFQYASGNPYTPIVGAVQKHGQWYVIDGLYNSTRYPDFHKLDIRIDRVFHFQNWTLQIYLDLWNVYNRKNVLDYYYNIDHNGNITKDTFNDFPMLPIVGINVQF